MDADEPTPAAATIARWGDVLPLICETIGALIPYRYREFREPFTDAEQRPKLCAIWDTWLDTHYPITDDADLVVRCGLTFSMLAPCAMKYRERRRYENARTPAPAADLREDEIGQEFSREEDGAEDERPDVDLGPQQGMGRGGLG